MGVAFIRLGRGSSVWSISTPHRSTLVNKFARLHISRTLSTGIGTTLAFWTRLITLLFLANIAQQIQERNHSANLDMLLLTSLACFI